ncbi:MAG: DUF1566 domain-containing protein [Deltaproteobacteria bacterium]|nr:DUF1566 domain-containing protein [Deltaproteobacteria bacterium]
MPRSMFVSKWLLTVVVCLATASGVGSCGSGIAVDGSGGVGAAAGRTGGASGSGGFPGSGGRGAVSTGGTTTGSGSAIGSGGGSSGGASNTGGITASGGRATPGTGGTSSTGGVTGGAGRPGTGGAVGTGGGPGSGGGNGSGGSNSSGGMSGTAGASGSCAPVNCGTHRWACWRMPNPTSAGLPNPASYTDLGNGTVRDNVTCLTWQKTVSATSYTVAAGRAYCATLGTGWRLATRIEMMSILDFTQSGAKADPVGFPSTPRAFFKTGSEWVLTTKQIGVGAGKDLGWAFNFSDGIVSNARSSATPDRARCVRGTGDADLDTAPGALAVAPPNQYTLMAAGEVQDNYTGLIWQQGTSPTQMSFVDAKTYCATLGLNAHTWRLPSIREVSTLVDEALVAPSINRTMFPGTKSGGSANWYWSSHNAAGSTTAAWGINFDDGFTGANTATSTTAWNYFTTVWARCVR